MGSAMIADKPTANGNMLVDPENIILKAIEHGVSIEGLERLLAMRADLQKEVAREAFARAMADFQGEMPMVLKSRMVQTPKFIYHYADLADIQRAIGPRLKAHGLAFTFDHHAANGVLYVGCTVSHLLGHSQRSEFPCPMLPPDRMNAIQAIGAAMTYGKRYALCSALGIITADEDTDAQTCTEGQPPDQATPFGGPPRQHPSSPFGGPPQGQPEPPAAMPPGPGQGQQLGGGWITPAQHRLLEVRISELGLDRDRVKAWVLRAWGVAHLDQVPIQRLGVLLEKLNRWAADAREQAEERAAIQADSNSPRDTPPPPRSADAETWIGEYESAFANTAGQTTGHRMN